MESGSYDDSDLKKKKRILLFNKKVFLCKDPVAIHDVVRL